MEKIITSAEDKNHSIKKYKTVMADPPWDINQRGKYNRRSAESHYELMPVDRIKAMPVASLCEENAHLYLWVPNGLLQEGLDVIKAWGFTFRSPIYWIKPRLSLGNYVRNASETLLLPPVGKLLSNSMPNPTGCSRRNKSTAISQKSSLLLSNVCRMVRILSSSHGENSQVGTAGGMKYLRTLLCLVEITPYQTTVLKH